MHACWSAGELEGCTDGLLHRHPMQWLCRQFIITHHQAASCRDPNLQAMCEVLQSRVCGDRLNHALSAGAIVAAAHSHANGNVPGLCSTISSCIHAHSPFPVLCCATLCCPTCTCIPCPAWATYIHANPGLHPQGFVHYVSSGPLRVDVEALNDQMKPAGALRLRHAQVR